ncbi:MAG: hypothetical protein QG608_3611 [Actinomycetota bacterium]|nr:hypothetical protein [Actinomycetota bacterium]
MRMGDQGGAPQDPQAGPGTRRASRRRAEPSASGTPAVFWQACPLLPRILLVGYPLLLIVGFFLKFFTVGEALKLFFLALSGALFLMWLAPRQSTTRPGRGTRNRSRRRVEQPAPAAEPTGGMADGLPDGLPDAGAPTTMWAGPATPSDVPAAGSRAPTTVWGALQEPSDPFPEQAGSRSDLFPDRSAVAGPFTEPGGFSQADLFSAYDGRPVPGSYSDLDSEGDIDSSWGAAPDQGTGPYGEQSGHSALGDTPGDTPDNPGPAAGGTPGRAQGRSQGRSPRHR